jgi:hypothetical protein
VTIEEYVRRAMQEKCRREEAVIRELLSRWVSGDEPAVARGPDGEIIGLCQADAMIGSKPFILGLDHA